ncbi:MAG: nuclear transport factor 2 family protein [Macellibacteroides fermentans]|uniref:nuclear transport factor 2 family protein n=1 Tax=Macellibacteroides fermentans TaxID=879969 RepID=UPI003AD017A8
MKRIVLFVALLVTTFSCIQQESDSAVLNRLQLIEDKMAIKEVVDVFSNLADTKEIDKQVLLFTEDGVVQSYNNGTLSSDLKGRKQLFDAFSGFLSNFKTVYHQNGQQTIDELTANTAKATSYCRVILVGDQNGKPVKVTLYTIYKDEFVKQDGKWLIKKRTSNFVHSETD